jgi:hypothetical protein
MFCSVCVKPGFVIAFFFVISEQPITFSLNSMYSLKSTGEPMTSHTEPHRIWGVQKAQTWNFYPPCTTNTSLDAKNFLLISLQNYMRKAPSANICNKYLAKNWCSTFSYQKDCIKCFGFYSYQLLLSNKSITGMAKPEIISDNVQGMEIST